MCGYIIKSHSITSLVLGQYSGDDLIYKGHVTMGMSKEDFKIISDCKKIGSAPFQEYPENENMNDEAIWIKPELVCTVKYMEKT